MPQVQKPRRAGRKASGHAAQNISFRNSTKWAKFRAIKWIRDCSQDSFATSSNGLSEALVCAAVGGDVLDVGGSPLGVVACVVWLLSTKHMIFYS